jgi:hypothetical protein
MPRVNNLAVQSPRLRVVEDAPTTVDPEQEQVTDAGQMAEIIDEELEKVCVTDGEAAQMRNFRRMLNAKPAKFDVRAVTGPPEGQPVTVTNFRQQVQAAIVGGLQTGSLRSVCMNQQGTGNWKLLNWDRRPPERGVIKVYAEFIDTANGKVVEYDAFGLPKNAEQRATLDPDLVHALTRAATAMEKSVESDEKAALQKKIAELEAQLETKAKREAGLAKARDARWGKKAEGGDTPPQE